MKNLITILILIFLISCNENSSLRKTENINEISYTKLQLFLINYLEKNPDITNNEITFRNSTKLFNVEIIDFIKNNDSIFYYHPLMFSGLSEVNGKIIGRFETFGYIRKNKKIESESPDSWGVSVNMELSEKNINSMKEREYYRIIGSNVGLIKSQFERDIPNIREGIFKKEGGRTLEFNLGNWIVIPEKIEMVN